MSCILSESPGRGYAESVLGKMGSVLELFVDVGVLVLVLGGEHRKTNSLIASRSFGIKENKSAYSRGPNARGAVLGSRLRILALRVCYVSQG